MLFRLVKTIFQNNERVSLYDVKTVHFRVFMKLKTTHFDILKQNSWIKKIGTCFNRFLGHFYSGIRFVYISRRCVLAGMAVNRHKTGEFHKTLSESSPNVKRRYLKERHAP